MWSVLKAWFGGSAKSAKARTVKPARAAKPTRAAKPSSAADAAMSRERLIEQALAVRAEKRAVLDELDPATRARIERAALGKLKGGDKKKDG
jgi:hypothetical protein